MLNDDLNFNFIGDYILKRKSLMHLDQNQLNEAITQHFDEQIKKFDNSNNNITINNNNLE